MPIIPVQRRLRQEGFEVRGLTISEVHLKTNNNKLLRDMKSFESKTTVGTLKLCF